MKPVVIGIDIGGTNTRLAVIDKEGKIISKNSILTTDYETVNDFVEELTKRINKQLSLLPTPYSLQGIGIGSPNGNFHRGTIENTTNLKWKGIIPFVELMKKNFDLPVFITNDAKAAAMGEMIYGAAKGMKDFVVITLGTGLGSGFVVNGEVMYGYSGFAGELGHTIMVQDGRACGCGRKGCLETYVSATGITKTAIDLLKNTETPSLLRDPLLSRICSEYAKDPSSFRHLNSKQIYEAALKDDKLALEAFDYTAKLLGIRLADTAAITSPEAIFLFGGLAEAGEYIFKPTSHYMDLYLLRHLKGTVKLLPSGIEQSNAAVLGASALVWHNI